MAPRKVIPCQFLHLELLIIVPALSDVDNAKHETVHRISHHKGARSIYNSKRSRALG